MPYSKLTEHLICNVAGCGVFDLYSISYIITLSLPDDSVHITRLKEHFTILYSLPLRIQFHQHS